MERLGRQAALMRRQEGMHGILPERYDGEACLLCSVVQQQQEEMQMVLDSADAGRTGGVAGCNTGWKDSL